MSVGAVCGGRWPDSSWERKAGPVVTINVCCAFHSQAGLSAFVPEPEFAPRSWDSWGDSLPLLNKYFKIKFHSVCIFHQYDSVRGRAVLMAKTAQRFLIE